MELGLRGKRAIVTGGSRGIGRAVARALLEEGVRVVIAARGKDALDNAADELATATGGEVHAVIVDTRDDQSVDALIEAAVVRLGGLDIVVNAGTRPSDPTTELSIASIEPDYTLEQFDTKVIGYLRVARAAAPHLVAQGWGRIINIGGLGAYYNGMLSGTLRNIAVVALTKRLADELGPKGVNVTAVHPGATRTETTAEIAARRAAADGISQDEAEKLLFSSSLIGRIVEAEEFADVVTFLASPRSVAIIGDAISAGGGTPGMIRY